MIRKKGEHKKEVRKNMHEAQGEVTIVHYFNKDEFGAACRLCAQLILPPGAGIGEHRHVDEDEVFIIEKGRGIVTENGKEFEVEAGDTILTGKGGSHAIKNTGVSELVVTAIIIKYTSVAKAYDGF